MAEITVKRNGEFQRAILSTLSSQPDYTMRASDLLKALQTSISLTPFELGTYPSGGLRFEKIARFASIAPVKAGWLAKDKGYWTATKEGLDALSKYADPEDLYRHAKALYKHWLDAQSSEMEPEVVVDSVSTEELEATASVKLEEAEESAWQEIARYVEEMNPYDFQDLVGALLRGLGYHLVWTASPGKDGGVDLIAAPDPLGTRPPRIKVQVKRQKASVTVDGLRSFMATLGNDDVGLFVATGGFTKDARDEARSQTTRRVTLVDLGRFYDLWVEHYANLTEEDRRRLPLKPVYFLALG